MGKKGKQRQHVEMEDVDEDGFGGLGDLFVDPQENAQGGWGAGDNANNGTWGIQPADSASNVYPSFAGWPPQQQQPQQQHQHHQQQQQQHQQQQRGGKQGHATGGNPDPRGVAAAAALAQWGAQVNAPPTQPGSRHEQMQAMKQAQMQQLQQQLQQAQGQFHTHLQGQQQQQPGKQRNESRGRQQNKKNKNKVEDPWGGGGGDGAWAAADPTDQWGVSAADNGNGVTWGGGGGAEAGAWGDAQGGGWGAAEESNWANQQAGNSWGEEANGNGAGAWGGGGGGGGGGGWGNTPASHQHSLHQAFTNGNQGAHHGHAPGMAQSESWAGWGAASGVAMDGGGAFANGRTPKQQLLSSLLGAFKGGQGQNNQNKKNKGKNEGKKGKKNKKQNMTPYASPWQAVNVIEEKDEYEEDYYPDEEMNQNWYNTAQTGWDDPMYSMPSKAYALAADGHDPVAMHRPKETPYMELQFIDSRGVAIYPAQRALYSTDRVARNRIHWMFDPQKDERVSSLLEWIQAASNHVASFGLNKFLQGRERGALFVNADYRPPNSPSEPAFDWIPYDHIIRTYDRTLQESIAYYDVHTQVLVFVFLLSKTGNSMAMWRRKVALPNNLRLAFASQIAMAKAALRKEYPIHIDENPEDVPPPPPKSTERNRLTKKKWFNWGR